MKCEHCLLQDIRSNLEVHSDGMSIIGELESLSGLLNKETRLCLVQILVAYLIKNHGDRFLPINTKIKHYGRRVVTKNLIKI